VSEHTNRTLTRQKNKDTIFSVVGNMKVSGDGDTTWISKVGYTHVPAFYVASYTDAIDLRTALSDYINAVDSADES
jgi:glyoxylate utilization-related uncharacterized protein